MPWSNPLPLSVGKAVGRGRCHLCGGATHDRGSIADADRILKQLYLHKGRLSRVGFIQPGEFL